MLLQWPRFSVQLQSGAEAISHYWQRLFAGWLTFDDAAAAAQLHLSLVPTLPPLPTEPPFFVDSAFLPESVGRLCAYRRGEQEVLLHYEQAALVNVPLSQSPPLLTGQIVERALAYGRLEDITFTSLAPALRRCGYYLVHAFGAVRDGRCVLLIGPSGSGKTTTGLSLILEGWQLLANDTLLIEAREDGIYALSTPGGLTVRPQTLTLLPACRPLLGDAPLLHGGYTLTNQQLADPTTTAARITAVYFCQIEDREQSARRPLSQAVALARLMEQSVDRWDEAMLTQHIAVLHQLSQQTAAYTLHLGRDVPRLPHLFAA